MSDCKLTVQKKLENYERNLCLEVNYLIYYSAIRSGLPMCLTIICGSFYSADCIIKMRAKVIHCNIIQASIVKTPPELSNRRPKLPVDYK